MPAATLKPLSFSSESRLKSAGDFDYVFKKPRRSTSRYFTVLVRPNALGQARLGLIISKKVAKQAVRRNRLKRIIRESFRQHGDVLAGLDVVVIGKPSANFKDNQLLFETINRHWKDLG